MNKRRDKRGRARRRARRGRRAALRVALLIWPALGWATVFAALAAGGVENLYRSAWRFIHEMEEQIMHTNVNLEAALGVMGLLGTGFALFVLGLVFLHALWRRKPGRARASAVAGLGVLILYVGAMLAFALVSREQTLAPGEEKYFCEIDCHLAYSVIGARRAKTIGEAPTQATAQGEFHVVTVRTRFDESTISATRPREAPLTPNPRRLTLFDGQGRAHEISLAGQRALEATGGAGVPLTTPLKPGESYTTELVFDMPPGASDPVLLVNEADLPTRLIIGHENSLLHKQTKFRLSPLAG